MAKAFLDTNIFFYAIDPRDGEKHTKARTLIAELASSGECVVSAQVIQEFANNAMKKLGFTPDEAITLCVAFGEHTIVKPDLKLVSNALRLMTGASVSFWDACILAAADQAQCKILYTEDLNSEQRFGGVRVVNPFI